MSTELGRLEKVELREAWVSESSNFTPWLAQDNNLNLLGAAIGLELELASQEKDVGPFRADILCRDTATNDWVLIENQLERTDHTHLGQLLTYAAGLNAVTVVWIAKQFTEEHRAALDWLNERTDEHINLFGLEIELWRIGDSPIAPKFNVISQPNDWSRNVQREADKNGNVSSLKQLQLKFWTMFSEYLMDKNSVLRCQKPFPQNWMNHSIGRSFAHLVSIISLIDVEFGFRNPQILAELYIDGIHAKKVFLELENYKEKIETELGFSLIWVNPESKVTCRIFLAQDADFLDEKLWPEHFEWLRNKQENMYKVFAPIIKTIIV